MAVDEARILVTAMMHEVQGEQFYRMAAVASKDADVRQAFVHLAAEKARHCQVLRDLLAGVQQGQVCFDPEVLGGAPAADALAQVASQAASCEVETCAFKVGILLEKATIDYYRQAAGETDLPEARRLYERLMAWGYEHLDSLERTYEQITDAWFEQQRFSPA
ncbi:MAG: ferritin family protein [Syntrophomonadaceae bacterium]|nr:ferritin family protein [Syntrophomonadaceae bacterium]